MKKRILSILLTLCTILCLVPSSVFAENESTKTTATADFTDSDGGAAAIALLNNAKTGATDSTWNNSTKTLTLNGIDFTATSTTAVKLPAGTTIILADGTENIITGGDSTVSQDSAGNDEIFIYGIYVAGALTIQGGVKGSGTLSVNSGALINSGDAITNSVAIYTDGDLTVNGGTVTAKGGKSSCAGYGFSYGVQIGANNNLSITGGMLTGIGGESLNTKYPDYIHNSFSEGIYTNCGDVTVSGRGKLIAETVPDIVKGVASFGLNITSGNLYISDNAMLTAKTGNAVNISDGDMKISGGNVTIIGTVDDTSALAITKYQSSVSGNGNLEITGGEFECPGGIYMYTPNPGDEQGLFSVTGGKVTTSHIYGSNILTISSGSVTSGCINANTVNLKDGNLTVREAVKANQSTGDLSVSHAIYCKNLAISGGVLDAAWEWGEYAPIVFPNDTHWRYPTPLIRIPNGTASFSGGTVILDTGCAGNMVLKTYTLNLTGGIAGTGYTNNNASGTYIQSDSNTPVKFSQSADYNKVNTALDKAKKLDKNLYKNFSAVDTAVNAVVYGKHITEQAAVDDMARAIEAAIAALEYKDADYTKVDMAVAKANSLNKDDYKDYSAVQSAIDAVVRGKNITEQASVDDMTKSIENAIIALEKKSEEIKPELPDIPPSAGDNINTILWLTLLFISGGTIIGATVVGRKRKNNCC